MYYFVIAKRIKVIAFKCPSLQLITISIAQFVSILRHDKSENRMFWKMRIKCVYTMQCCGEMEWTPTQQRTAEVCDWPKSTLSGIQCSARRVKIIVVSCCPHVRSLHGTQNGSVQQKLSLQGKFIYRASTYMQQVHEKLFFFTYELSGIKSKKLRAFDVCCETACWFHIIKSVQLVV